MKKQLLTAFFAGAMVFAKAGTPGTEDVIKNRGCGTMEYTAWEEKNDPSIKAVRAQIEKEIEAYVLNQMTKPDFKPQAVIKMPIVFHVVYNTSAENLSDNCLQKTLDAFNKDFRKLNTDFATKCPSVFQPMAADFELEFCFASKDPTGAASNGITRTQTSVTSFSTNNAVKYTAQGGHDVWDRTKFVNMWVCDLGSSLLGYGQFPGGSAATDGVVCHYKYMHKDGGCGATPFELGRTTVHELGHFFNLRHIWGDANCGDDMVADTPTQQTSNYGCPAFPKVTCSNGPNGDMHMNYMDYVDDRCMVMFTAGQKTRMLAALNGTTRSGLKTSAATYCSAGTSVNELELETLVHLYPNPSTGEFILNLQNTDISNADLIIYNALGDAILEKKIVVPSNGEVSLDLNDQPEGMYLVKVKSKQGDFTKKIVVNR